MDIRLLKINREVSGGYVASVGIYDFDGNHLETVSIAGEDRAEMKAKLREKVQKYLNDDLERSRLAPVAEQVIAEVKAEMGL